MSIVVILKKNWGQSELRLNFVGLRKDKNLDFSFVKSVFWYRVSQKNDHDQYLKFDLNIYSYLDRIDLTHKEWAMAILLKENLSNGEF